MLPRLAEDPLNPRYPPKGWRSFADEPLGRRERHWCPACVEFIKGHEASLAKMREEQIRLHSRRKPKSR